MTMFIVFGCLCVKCLFYLLVAAVEEMEENSKKSQWKLFIEDISVLQLVLSFLLMGEIQYSGPQLMPSLSVPFIWIKFAV